MGLRRAPPRLFEGLLRHALPPEERDAVLGDLEEAWRCGPGGVRGLAWYAAQTLLLGAGFAVQRIRERREGPAAAARRRITMTRGVSMETWVLDLRTGARSLARRPAFTTLAIVTLTLGIGAGTAIFSVVYGTLLRPFPFPDSHRLVVLSDSWKASGGWGSSMVYLNVLELRARSTLLEGLAPYTSTEVNLATEDRPERVSGLAVDPSFLGVLGLPPVLGRDFTAEDDTQAGRQILILGHGLWRQRFGGDPTVLGRTLLLNSVPHTVVGVASPELEFPGDPRFLVPFGWSDRDDLSRGTRNVNAIGRLAPDASLESARVELATLFSRIEEEYPESNEGWTVDARTLEEWVSRSSRGSLMLMSGAALMVLLIALVNVANLVMVRAESRQREIALRLALGSARGGLLPFFLGETLLLSAAGGVLGSLTAYGGVRGLVALYGSSLPRADQIGPSGVALLVAVGLSLLSALVVALVPALRTDTGNLQRDLGEGSRAVSRSSTRFRTGLVVAEIALAVVLVAGAGLFLNSFWRLNRVDLGIEDEERILTFQVSLAGSRYDDRAELDGFQNRMTERIRSLPGVEAVGITSRLPLFGGYNITNLTARGRTEPVAHFVEIRTVTPGFFDVLGVPLVAGRMFTETDRQAVTPGVLITEELAERLFPDGRAIGERVDFNWFGDEGAEVLGVVGDIRDLGHLRPPPPGLYLPYGPGTAQRGMIVTVRAGDDPAALLPDIRTIVASLDRGIPVHSAELLADVVARRVGRQRFATSLLSIFAGLALLLGAIGIYGVMSYSVAQRTREVGVRIALGAHRVDVVGLILRQGMVTAAIGVVLGVAGGLATGRLIADQLFEVSSTDPLTYLVVSGVLALASLAACYLPAVRASSVDPSEALRSE